MEQPPFIDFDGRWVIVTGASSGIGRAIALELARRSARVVLVGRDEERLRETKEALTGHECEVIAQDLSRHEALVPLVRGHAERHGRIYGLCHCAGVVETRPLAAFQPAGLQAMTAVNLTAGLELSRALCRRDVLAEDGGSLLFVASIYGSVGMPGQVAYSATKGALVAAARTLAVELARRKVRVNTLSPGLVRTPMTDSALSLLSKEQAEELVARHPLGVGAPEDVGRAAAFLLAPQSAWITGIDLIIDGGYTAS